MSAAASAPIHDKPPRRGFWLKHLARWHWISSALSLVGMLAFAITGFTLNHAGAIETSPRVTHHETTLPSAVMSELTRAGPTSGDEAPLPQALRDWLHESWDVTTGTAPAQWSADEAYLSLPRPGGDAWLAVDLETGMLEYERTDRGWIAWFNDLHKGRNAGPWWSWFIDVFALACIVFCVTGLLLLTLHAKNRSSTWPLVGLGLVIPLLLTLLFIH